MAETPHIEISPFSKLSPSEIAGYQDQANWLVAFPDGTQRGDWLYVLDSTYRVKIDHTQVQWGQNKFDKCNILGWGALVLPMRVSPDGLAEFCLNKERRIMLRDEDGQQGGISTDNIPQGAIDPGESTIQASLREAKSETGHLLSDILLMGKGGYDIANSEALQDIFIGLVPYGIAPVDQNLDTTEDLEWKWHTWNEIGQLEILDMKTEAALYKAFKILRPELLIPNLIGTRFRLDRSLVSSQDESLEWYVKPDLYPTLRAQTVENYPHAIHNL